MVVDTLAFMHRREEILSKLGVATLPAIWLRPKPQDKLASTTSKLGGPIAWPADVSWPICEARDVLMDYLTVQNDFLVPVGQFLKTDFPEISFPSGSDVLQILWCPRYHTHP